MRIFRYGPPGAERVGVLDADGVRRDLASLPDSGSQRVLSPEGLDVIRQLDLAVLPVVSESERLGPCTGNVRNFVAVGLNYADHARESKLEVPAEPVLFNKAPSCVSGPCDPIILPVGSKKTDWEVELAVVIGSRAWCVSEANAPSVVAGFCICNDVSERSYQLEGSGQWMKGKGCPTFGPLGPWLVTRDEIPDLQTLDLWLKVNGEEMQYGSTRTMIFNVYYLVSYVSRFMMLEPGDVITTGTPPGVGLGMKPPRYLRPGDVVEAGITGLGVQRQSVRDAALF